MPRLDFAIQRTLRSELGEINVASAILDRAEKATEPVILSTGDVPAVPFVKWVIPKIAQDFSSANSVIHLSESLTSTCLLESPFINDVMGSNIIRSIGSSGKLL